MAGPETPAPAPDPEPASKSHFDEQADGETREEAATGGERSRALNDFLSMYGTRTSGVSVVGASVHIDKVIGGDAFLGEPGDEDRLILKVITERTVTELRTVYVEPAGFTALGEPLARTGLLLLGTRPRWGNTATATRLLDGLKTIYEVPFSGSVADLPIAKLPAGSGFIVEAAEPRALLGLNPRSLAELEDGLRAAGSRLVVVTGTERAAEHGGRPVWRAVAAPPDAYAFALRHLEAALQSREQGAELLDQDGLADRLRAMTPGTFDAVRLVELAADLAEAAAGRGTLADAITRFDVRADQAVEQWFDSDDIGDNLQLKAVVLALAVLNDMSYDAVSRAARLLEQRWRAGEPAPAPGTRRRPMTRSQLITAARARITTEVRPTRFGAATLDIASFWDPRYPQRLLRHYWQEHDYDRDVLLDWLREVADDVEVAVGVRAAGAIGFLATFAFDTVRRDVIVPWAGSGKGNERELAVAALALPARTPETTARTERMVSFWASRKAGALQMAAVRALGGSVGAILDPGPDELLGKLAVGAGGRLATAIGESIGELLAEAGAEGGAEDEQERRLALLRLLSDWAGERLSGRQTAGVLGFLQAAWSQWCREPGGPAWPLMLWLAQRDERMGALIAKLWGIALVARGADNGVRLVLHSWAQAAERDSDIRQAFVTLLAAVPRNQRQADLLMHHAEKLRTGKPSSPDTARRLLDALTKGR